MKKILKTMMAIALLNLVLLTNANAQNEIQLSNTKGFPITIVEIKSNLIKDKQCQFNCNALIETRIKKFNKEKKEIEFEFEVSAEKASLVILPFKTTDISWNEIKLNNKEWNNTTVINNLITVAVNEGLNTINIKGTLNKNSNRINLEKEIKVFKDLTGNGFKIIQNNEQKTLILDEEKYANNIEKNQTRNTIVFGNKTLFNITRDIYLSDRWKVRTFIEPLNISTEKSETLEINLIKGEKPISDILVKDGKAIVEIINNKPIFWESDINIANELNVEAINDAINNIRVHNMNDWVYEVEGKNPIHTMVNNRTQDLKSWVIYDKETLNMKLSLPIAIDGKQNQIKNYKHERLVNNNLINNKIIIEIVSTLGGQYEVEIPNTDFKIRSLKINNIEKNIDKQNNILLINLNRGSNHIEILADSENRKIISNFPELKFKDQIYNAYFEWKNEQRWVIWAGNGDSKPSVLLWGILITLMGLAYILSKYKRIPLSMTSWFLLFVGLTQSSLILLLLTIMWFFAFAYRESLEIRDIQNQNNIFKFKLLQVGLVILTFIIITNLIATIANGLLERPEMYLVGMNVYGNQLAWYSEELRVTPYIISLPLWVYKLVMFIWSFWLAFKLINWLRWMWSSYSKNGYWIKVEKQKNEQLDENIPILAETDNKTELK